MDFDRAAGIFPLNKDIFDDVDFVPAAVHIPEVLSVVPDLNQEIITDERTDQVQSLDVTPESIRPLPRLQVNERKEGRRKGTSLVLT